MAYKLRQIMKACEERKKNKCQQFAYSNNQQTIEMRSICPGHKETIKF